MAEAKIITYTNLLHEHKDQKAKPVVEFFEKNKKDKTFEDRAKKLNKLFSLKTALKKW